MRIERRHLRHIENSSRVKPAAVRIRDGCVSLNRNAEHPPELVLVGAPDKFNGIATARVEDLPALSDAEPTGDFEAELVQDPLPGNPAHCNYRILQRGGAFNQALALDEVLTTAIKAAVAERLAVLKEPV